MAVASLADIRGRIGQEVGLSDWIVIDQARIDAFAEATEDRQFIHVDPAAAATTPFGGTIAHGFLTLSLLSRLGAAAIARSEFPAEAYIGLFISLFEAERGHCIWFSESIFETQEGRYVLEGLIAPTAYQALSASIPLLPGEPSLLIRL